MKETVDVELVRQLLETVAGRQEEYKDLLNSTAERFNMFDILGRSERELLHSRMLGALLNPRGTHGQGSVFLEKFINELGLPPIENAAKSRVYVEKDYGIKVDSKEEEQENSIHKYKKNLYPRGGRIDLLVEPQIGKSIVVENKIYAYDQPSQLLRYFNNLNKDCILVYLTLYGATPGEDSWPERHSEELLPISYKKTICDWLIECIKLPDLPPVVLSTLMQYHNLLRQMTGQGSTQKLNMEIHNIIAESNQSFLAAAQVAEQFHASKGLLAQRFLQELSGQIEVFGFRLNLTQVEEALNFGLEGDRYILIEPIDWKFKRHNAWLGYDFSDKWGFHFGVDMLQAAKNYIAWKKSENEINKKLCEIAPDGIISRNKENYLNWTWARKMTDLDKWPTFWQTPEDWIALSDPQVQKNIISHLQPFLAKLSEIKHLLS